MKKVVTKEDSGGLYKLAFLKRVFDLVPLSVDGPWLFLVCCLAGTPV
jgi:hypothetical protein